MMKMNCIGMKNSKDTMTVRNIYRMNKVALENLRQECRYRVNPAMERSELKEFTDYVVDRHNVLEDAIQQAYRDLYQNFREDRGYD